MDSTSFYFDEDSQEEVETAWTIKDRQSPRPSREHIAIATKPLPALPPSISPSLPATHPTEVLAELPIARLFLTEYDPPTPDPTKPANTDSIEPTSSTPRSTPSSDSITSTTLERSSQGPLVARPEAVFTDTTPRRSYTAKEIKLRTERNIKYFQDSILTEDRLRMLGSRWLNRALLKNVLSYCKPFIITLPRTHLSSSDGIKTQLLRSDKDLVTIDHHHLFNYLHEHDHWDAFIYSFSNAWPRTLGCLVDTDGSDPHYLWPRDAIIPDDEAAIICRKSVPRGQGHQALLASLFRGFALAVHPQDNMLW